MIIHSEVVPSEIASESASEIAPESVSFLPRTALLLFLSKGRLFDFAIRYIKPYSLSLKLRSQI